MSGHTEIKRILQTVSFVNSCINDCFIQGRGKNDREDLLSVAAVVDAKENVIIVYVFLRAGEYITTHII